MNLKKSLSQLKSEILPFQTDACIQLIHSGRQTSSTVIGEQPVAPSPIPYPGAKETPRELSVQEIKQLVDCFSEAAYRAKMTGADMIELNCFVNENL